MKNPLLVMTIILVVLVVGLVAVTLFAKQKVVMADGTTGKVSYFGSKTTAPAVEEPLTEPAV